MWEMGNLKANTVKEYSQIFLRILSLLLNIKYVFRPLILPTGGPMSRSTDEWKSWREATPGGCVPKDAEESQRSQEFELCLDQLTGPRVVCWS